MTIHKSTIGSQNTVGRKTAIGRMTTWAHANMPTREQMERNRFARPLAARHELWRFTRRSVPRGVAVGLFIGIFLMIPGLQLIGAALLCMPFRANVPIAALMTFVSVPPTTLFVFLPGAIWVGNRIGYHADLATMSHLFADGASLFDWLAWLGTDAAPALVIGLAVIGLVAAVAGYVLTAIGWRWHTARKRRQRTASRGGSSRSQG